MKIIYKILDYFPETNQISVRFCNLKSTESIDSYKSRGVNCDNLDMFDVESFSESLVNQSGIRRVEKQENELVTLDDNKPDTIQGSFEIRDLIGKVICVKRFNREVQKLHMMRIEL